MTATSQVSERGQITIDKTIRKRLSVKPGMIAYQRVVEGWKLEILFLPAPHRESQFGVFYEEGAPPGPLTGEELEEAVMEGLAEEQRLIEDEEKRLAGRSGS